MSEVHKRTPRLVPERGDARNFPLSPTDGYVLSRITGALNEADLIASMGLPEAQVQASLAKLETLGLIAFDGDAPPRAIEAPRVPAAAPTSEVHLRAPPSAATVSPRTDPSEEIDLDPALSRRVADVHRDMQQRDYYWLLGVEPKADRKAIKRAYYELAAVFHPDRYFRKRLGSFKVQMEAIFSRLTLAHDTLSVAETRGEYDEYLAEQRRSRAMEDDLAEAPLRARQAAETIERAVQAQEARTSASPPAAPATLTPPTRPSAAPAVDVNVATRRTTLVRRLLGGAPGPSSTPPSGGSGRGSAAGQPPAMQTGDAMDALRRRYEERLRLVRAGEALKYSRQADTALAAGELVAAASAFRIAANLATDDAELERKAQESRVKADVILGDTYTRQARYEEAHDQWGEAARSWARVCKVRPDDAGAHERASHAILKSGGDLREGAQFARRACDIDPKNPLYRIVLASCYAGAGLALNARRELDTAAQLAPQDGTIQAMIRNVESRPDVARRE